MFNGQLNRAMMLEMTRLHSVHRQSELVLCTNFLPWLDLALSADCEGSRASAEQQETIESRWLEMAKFIASVNETQGQGLPKCTILLSFGLIRCWHVDARSRFVRAYAPIRHIIDGGRWFERARWAA